MREGQQTDNLLKARESMRMEVLHSSRLVEAGFVLLLMHSVGMSKREEPQVQPQTFLTSFGQLYKELPKVLHQQFLSLVNCFAQMCSIEQAAFEFDLHRNTVGPVFDYFRFQLPQCPKKSRAASRKLGGFSTEVLSFTGLHVRIRCTAQMDFALVRCKWMFALSPNLRKIGETNLIRLGLVILKEHGEALSLKMSKYLKKAIFEKTYFWCFFWQLFFRLFLQKKEFSKKNLQNLKLFQEFGKFLRIAYFSKP